MNLCYDGHFIHLIVSLFFQNLGSIVEVLVEKRRVYSAVVEKCGTLTVALVLPHGGYAGRGAVPRIENQNDGTFDYPDYFRIPCFAVYIVSA